MIGSVGDLQALALKARLLYRHDTVVTSVPFHLHDPEADDRDGDD